VARDRQRVPGEGEAQRRGPTLLAVVDGDRLLVGTPFGRLEPYADLSAAGSFFNDIVVDGRGNAYVGALGFDFGHGAPFAPGTVALMLKARPGAACNPPTVPGSLAPRLPGDSNW